MHQSLAKRCSLGPAPCRPQISQVRCQPLALRALKPRTVEHKRHQRVAAVTNEEGQIINQVAQKAIMEYTGMETEGKFAANPKARSEFRSKYNIKRGPDGRVWLKSSKGEWFQCRPDVEGAGILLLQNSKGLVFAIQCAMPQVDLSDDLFVLSMFCDGSWEGAMGPVYMEGEDGKTEQLKLTAVEFRQVSGVVQPQEQDEGEEGQDEEGQKQAAA